MTTMKQVMEAGKVVAAAHAKLLEVSDALADVMEIDRDSVLKQVMPLRARDRRDSKRVLDFLERKSKAIEEYLRHLAETRAETAAREQLLTRLNLTDAEKDLLGINLQNKNPARTE